MTISPARIKLDSPPEDGTDQIFPPAEKYSVLPSGEEAIDEISPLPGAIRLMIRPKPVSATAIVSRPIMNAICRGPAAVMGEEVSSVVATSGTGFLPIRERHAVRRYDRLVVEEGLIEANGICDSGMIADGV